MLRVFSVKEDTSRESKYPVRERLDDFLWGKIVLSEKESSVDEVDSSDDLVEANFIASMRMAIKAGYFSSFDDLFLKLSDDMASSDFAERLKKYPEEIRAIVTKPSMDWALLKRVSNLLAKWDGKSSLDEHRRSDIGQLIKLIAKDNSMLLRDEKGVEKVDRSVYFQDVYRVGSSFTLDEMRKTLELLLKGSQPESKYGEKLPTDSMAEIFQIESYDSFSSQNRTVSIIKVADKFYFCDDECRTGPIETSRPTLLAVLLFHAFHHIDFTKAAPFAFRVCGAIKYSPEAEHAMTTQFPQPEDLLARSPIDAQSLEFAVRSGSLESVSFLIAKGANPFIQGSDKLLNIASTAEMRNLLLQSMLSFAVKQGDRESVDKMLKAGAVITEALIELVPKDDVIHQILSEALKKQLMQYREQQLTTYRHSSFWRHISSATSDTAKAATALLDVLEKKKDLSSLKKCENIFGKDKKLKEMSVEVKGLTKA